MKRIHIVGGVLAAAALAGGGAALGTALGGPGAVAAPTAMSATTGPSAVSPPGIGTAALPPGTALVDGAGRTLYLFEADTGTTSTCTGACAQVWPPLLASAPSTSSTPSAGTGGAARAALVSTSARPDGTLQVTYDGHPLYYFAGDTAPGEAKGQGIHNFGGGWYVVAPAGNKIDPDDAPAVKSLPASPSGAGSDDAPAAKAAPASPSGAGAGYGY